jgi:hypothetical protein
MLIESAYCDVRTAVDNEISFSWNPPKFLCVNNVKSLESNAQTVLAYYRIRCQPRPWRAVRTRSMTAERLNILCISLGPVLN